MKRYLYNQSSITECLIIEMHTIDLKVGVSLDRDVPLYFVLFLAL